MPFLHRTVPSIGVQCKARRVASDCGPTRCRSSTCQQEQTGVKLETKLADIQRHLGVTAAPASAVPSPKRGRSIDELLRNQLRDDASGSCVVAENVRGAEDRHGLYAF